MLNKQKNLRKKQTNKWTKNEWASEQLNKWTNEQMSKWTTKQKNCKSDRAIEKHRKGVDQRIDKVKTMFNFFFAFFYIFTY